MSKDWVDIDNIFVSESDIEVNKDMRNLMQEVPKMKKRGNAHKVYEKNEFAILKVYGGDKVGYIVYNTNKVWEEGHTHINSFEMAKTIISNVIGKKKPKTKNVYLMKSHIRVSADEKYQDYIAGLIETRYHKGKDSYYNAIKK